MTNWDVNSCKFALKSFYVGAQNQTGNEQQACQWMAENSEQLFDIIDASKDKNGLLSGHEMKILFQANAELFDDKKLEGLAKQMHPIYEQIGMATQNNKSVDRGMFNEALKKGFLQFASSPSSETPPQQNAAKRQPSAPVASMAPVAPVAPPVPLSGPRHPNWDVEACKSALNNFYMGADMQTGNDQAACQWIAEHADQFFDMIDSIKLRDGWLSGEELHILFSANGLLLGDHFQAGIASKMHPVIEQMGLSTMQYGPIDRQRFRAILNQTFQQFAPAWGVQLPPTGVWGMQGVQPYEFHPGGMQPGIQVYNGMPFGMNLQGQYGQSNITIYLG